MSQLERKGLVLFFLLALSFGGFNMPISQMRSGLTAENSIFSQKPSINVKRSRFNIGRMNFFTADVGALIPVDIIPTLPGDDFDLSCQYKIDFRPLIVPTLTAYKVKIHYYYAKNEDLWSGWESFITKGRSGKLALTVPQIKLSQLTGSDNPTFSDLSDNFDLDVTGWDNKTYYPCAPHSLYDYLVGSVPYSYKIGDNVEEIYNPNWLPFVPSNLPIERTGFMSVDSSALPFLMYQKIYRSNYMDPNLMSNGTVESQVWFPDDIDSSHWRIDYSPSNLFGIFNQYFVPQNVEIPSGDIIANFVPKPITIGDSDSVGDNAINLLQLRYSMYTDDMFTTALPFLQRGNVQSIDFGQIPVVVGDPVHALGPNSFSSFDSNSFISLSDNPPDNPNANGLKFSGFNVSSSYLDKYSSYPVGYFRSLGGEVGKTQYLLMPFVSDASAVSFTAQQLRSLIALSVWQERNALTNGSYNQFIKVHFDKYPSSQYCEPIYIGGTTSVFNVNSVIQTSESGATPQGYQAGIGSSGNSQRLGRFHAPDYGYIMAIMTIIPDSSYVQSQDHWQFDKSPDDFYMPEFEQLSYQAILNKQLAYFGDDVVANGLYGYSNRYVYLKQRENVVHGRFALPASIDAHYHSYVQSRLFTSQPVLSQDFVTVYPPNIDRSFLAYPGEPAFLVQYYSGVNGVRALSYASQPNTFGF